MPYVTVRLLLRFATKCLCNHPTAECTRTLCCCPCGGPRPLMRRPTRSAACCGTGRRRTFSGARWPRTPRFRSDTKPVWRSTWINLRWWRPRRTMLPIPIEALAWAGCQTPSGCRCFRPIIVWRRTRGSSAQAGYCRWSGRPNFSVRRGRSSCLVGIRRSRIGSSLRIFGWRLRWWCRTWRTRFVTSTVRLGRWCTPSTTATKLPRGFAPCRRTRSAFDWTRRRSVLLASWTRRNYGIRLTAMQHTLYTERCAGPWRYFRGALSWRTWFVATPRQVMVDTCGWLSMRPGSTASSCDTRVCGTWLSPGPQCAGPCTSGRVESPWGGAPRSANPPGRGLCHWRRPWRSLPSAVVPSWSLAIGVAAARNRSHLADARVFLRGGCPVWVSARSRRAPSRVPWSCSVGSGACLGEPSHRLAPRCWAGEWSWGWVGFVQHWTGRRLRRRWWHQVRALCSAPRGCSAKGGGRTDALSRSERSWASRSRGRGTFGWGPQFPHEARGRVASRRGRGPALARDMFPVSSRVAATRRRSKVCSGVTRSVDPCGKVCSCRGAWAVTVVPQIT